MEDEIDPSKLTRSERMNVKTFIKYFRQEINSDRNPKIKMYFDFVKKILSKSFLIGILTSVVTFAFLAFVYFRVVDTFGFEHALILILVYFTVIFGNIAGGIGALVREFEKLNY